MTLRSKGVLLQPQADSDEWYAKTAYQQRDALMISETHLQVWLNSTPVIREMQRLVDDARTH